MRVKRGTAGRARHKRRLKLAEGFRGRRNGCFKLAKRAVEKALQFSYRDRRAKKRDFRGLWIVRINAAARMSGLSYSKFIRGLSNAQIELDRKVLAEIAFSDPASFAVIAEKAKAAL
jgi:large subunit ribosomal protein L20